MGNCNMVIIEATLFILVLIFSSYEASAQPYTTLVAPLKKDTATSLYTLILGSNGRYVVDLSAPFSWWRCPAHHDPPVGCFVTECFQATYLPSPCPVPGSSPTQPCMTCMVAPMNPVTKSCAVDQLTTAPLALHWTDGANPTAKATFNKTYLSCAPASLFRSLPKGALGLASLSLAPLSLPQQFLGTSTKLAMCLPSTSSSNGVIFFGDGPYNLLPGTNLDARSLLSYTPLLRNPKSVDITLGIKALSVGGNSIPMSPFEGITLSAVVPYTTMRTDVYKTFLDYFTKAMKGIPRMKSVKPFSACYKASAIGASRVGLHVPPIDLEFASAKNWTVYGANSMKQVGRDTACLAFLDGGERAALKMVIGAFQMEENLLVLDYDQSRLGFSSSLYFERITCSNFNFTAKMN